MSQLKEQDIFVSDVQYPWEFRNDYKSKVDHENKKLWVKKQQKMDTLGARRSARPKVDDLEVLVGVTEDRASVGDLRTMVRMEEKEIGDKGADSKNRIVVKMEELKPMKKLSKIFEAMKRECEAGITELENETTEMIGLVSVILYPRVIRIVANTHAVPRSST